MESLSNASINMVRPDLDDIPQHELFAPCSARWYEPGDEQHWVDIHLLADQYNPTTVELFRSQFGDDEELLGQRQCYLVDDEGQAIGTASAWVDPPPADPAMGRIHWVAIVPAAQGLGLAKPLLTQICNRLRDLGHTKAYLDTSNARIPAINLYLAFGFLPDVSSDEDLQAWREVAPHLRYPIDLPAEAGAPRDDA